MLLNDDASDDMCVAELCRALRVHRSTLYRRYRDRRKPVAYEAAVHRLGLRLVGPEGGERLLASRRLVERFLEETEADRQGRPALMSAGRGRPRTRESLPRARARTRPRGRAPTAPVHGGGTAPTAEVQIALGL